MNLGLDLQGGSYLLLEIDTKPLLKERLQEKIIPLKKFLQTITLNIQTLILKKRLYHLISKMINYPNLKHCLIKRKNNINPYIQRYNTHELKYLINNNSLKFLFKIRKINNK